MPSKLGNIFFRNETIIIWLRNPKKCRRSWLSRRKQLEAAIDGVNGTIDSVTNTAVVLVADLFPEGEMALEQ